MNQIVRKILIGNLFVATAFSQVVVNDVTQLNPITVERVVAPTSVEEITSGLKTHPGPVST